jgi:hypothetical protein
MSDQRGLARSVHWAVFAYGVVCLGVTFWLVIARWPIIAPDRQWMNPIALAFLMANIAMRFICTPSEGKSIKFWSGLFRFRAGTLRAIRRFLDVAFTAILAVGGLLVAWRFFSPETVTETVKHAALSGAAISLLVYPAVRFAALAAAGREVLYVLTDEERGALASARN